MNKTYLVTGSAGFIGSNLSTFLETKFQVIKLSFLKFSRLNDKVKSEYLSKLFLKHKPYAVIHLATYFSKKRK